MRNVVLVFAGGSFIGRHVCDALRQAGVDVVWTARKPLDGAEVCDLTDRDRVSELIAAVRPGRIVQCGAATTTSNPAEQFDLHVRGSLNVLEAAAQHVPQSSVLLFGSAAEYGAVPPAALPVREDYPAAPTSYFGASKLAQTDMARAAATERRLRVTVLRPFNVVGPGLPEHYFAASLARRLVELHKQGVAEFPVANATATRDFVDVRDVADAVVALLAHSANRPPDFQVYNVATGVETPLVALAERLGSLAGGLRPLDSGPAASRSSIARSCGDAAKLRADVGWAPIRAWEESIDDLWERQTEVPTKARGARSAA
jgi:NDP-hexose 4-ketoreductase